MPTSQKTKILQQTKRQREVAVLSIDEVLESFMRMQAKIFDMSVLKKFYDTNKKHPYDTCPWCLPILYELMTKQFELTITPEGFRRRLKKLERYGLIKKIPRTCPSVYEPIQDIKHNVRRAIILWLVKRGYQSI